MTANAPALVAGRGDSLLHKSGNAAELTGGQQANAMPGCKFQDVRLALNSYCYCATGTFYRKASYGW